MYNVTMICPTYIKEASQLSLLLTWNPSPQAAPCSSASGSLYSLDCAIKS